LKIFLRLFGKPLEHPTSPRWINFVRTIEEAGHELVSLDNGARAQLAIWVDYDAHSMERVSVNRDKRILVQIEPRSVFPRQYAKAVEEKFGHVVSESLTENGRKLHWQSGQFSHQDMEDLREHWDSPNERRIKVGLIVSNKNSAVAGSLYPLRRDTIKVLSENQIGFAYAGRGWSWNIFKNLLQDIKEIFIFITSGLSWKFFSMKLRWRRPSLQAYIGEQKSSREFLSNVEIAVVIENEANYFSEKLTDALYARCQIIYVGPKLSSLKTLRNVIFASPNVEDISNKLEILISENYADLNYSSLELESLAELTYEKANRKFVSLINEIVSRHELSN